MQTPTDTCEATVWPMWSLILLAILSLSVLIIKNALPLMSVDLWWHMALGRHIINTGQLVLDHSIFTWTPAIPYHAYNAWFAEILLYSLYEYAGPVGLIVFRYLIHGGFWALAIHFAVQRGVVKNPLTWVIVTFGTLLSFIAVYIKPEIFSFGFMYVTVWLYFFINLQQSRRWWLYYIFPLLVIFWVNSHGAFISGGLFFLSIGIGEILNMRFAAIQSPLTEPRKHLFLALLLCLPALLVNPYGFDLITESLHFGIAVATDLSGVIGAYDPTYTYNTPPFYALEYLIIALVIYLALLWPALQHRMINWAAILAILVYSLFYAKFVRTTYFLAPILVFNSLDLLGNRDIWAWTDNKNWRLALLSSCLIMMSFVSWRVINGTTCHSLGSFWSEIGFISSEFPVAEAEYIKKMPAINKLGNTYGDGGYLTFMLWPKFLTMIDARYFPFHKWVDRELAFESGNDVVGFLDDHDADVWLINHRNVALIDWFANSHWYPLFVGPAGVVFGKKSSPSQTTVIAGNFAHTGSFSRLQQLFLTTLSLQNWVLAEQVLRQTAIFAAKFPWCGHYDILAIDMKNAIDGNKAYVDGDYNTAASILTRKSTFVGLPAVAVKAITSLAKQAWNDKNYYLARTMAIDAMLKASQNVICLYNATIADWQYRRTTDPKQVVAPDGLSWEFLAKLVLQHRDKIPPGHVDIIGIITAMRNGTLHRKPGFIIP